MPRPPTRHREPQGALAIARHYVGDLVYGANDGIREPSRFTLSIFLTFATLFGIGSARAAVTTDRWWRAGLEMLLLGVAVAVAAYGSGAAAAWLIGNR